MAHLIDQNAILTLHCAISPVTVPGGENPFHDLTPVLLPAPYPPHPAHPRTWWIPATELSAAGTAVLREVVGDPCDTPLDRLTERLIRPLVIVFRELVDDSGRDLFVLDLDSAGFELTAGCRLTGRVVVTDAVDVPRRTAAARVAARAAVRSLAGYLTTVARRWAFAGGSGGEGTVLDRVDQVLAKELRFLRPDTVALLGENHPWASFQHAVDPGQDRNLRSVLRAVAECARRRRADPALPAPLVLVDPVLASTPGLRRFSWDVYDAGGTLVMGTARPEQAVVVACFNPAGAVIAVHSHPLAVAARMPSAFIVSTFETLPRGASPGGRSVPSLSHTRSLEELQLGELRGHRLARDHVVRLSAGESVDLIQRLVAGAEVAAARAAASAVIAHGPGVGPAADHRRIVRQVRHLLTRKQFIKGSRSYYTDDQAVTDMLDFVRAGAPIPLRMMGFPLKQWESGLKALGGLPDLAEVGALVRLRELHSAIKHVYPPGMRLTVLTDASHFRPRSASVTRPYERKLDEYAQIVGCAEFLSFVDIDTCAAAELGVDRAEHARCVIHHRRQLESGLAGMDITHDPLNVLRAVAECDPAGTLSHSVFGDLFMSIVFSVPVPLLAGADRMASSATIYDDLYRVGDDVPAEVAAARREVLAASWDATVRYVSTLRANHDLGYDALFAGHVRLKASAPRPGTCGFSFLGGSCLLPWQGTGAVSARGEVSTDFVVSLLDQGFVPVYSPLLGDEQPWLMVPVTATRVVSGGSAAQLDRQFASRIRLRRR